MRMIVCPVEKRVRTISIRDDPKDAAHRFFLLTMTLLSITKGNKAVNPAASSSPFGLGSRRNPRNDQGIFIAIVVRDFVYDFESQLKIEGLSPFVAPPHFCPQLLKVEPLNSLLDEFLSNPPSPMVRMDGYGDDMPISREDEIA